jgi:hypothetical protein
LKCGFHKIICASKAPTSFSRKSLATIGRIIFNQKQFFFINNNFMKRRQAIVIILFFYSCKVTDINIVGHYKMNHFPKSTLTLKSDNNFEFIQNYRNPYLHAFEHPDEYYFRTIGKWKRDGKIITLNSSSDSLIYPLYKIVVTDSIPNKKSYLENDPAYNLMTRNSKTTEFCNYVFYDLYNDTVPILYVKTPLGDVARLHGSMKYFSWDKKNKDTLEFSFFGYRPVTIINSKNGETNYKIDLQPEFKPNWFKDTKLKVSRKKIKHLKNGVEFKK